MLTLSTKLIIDLAVVVDHESTLCDDGKKYVDLLFYELYIEVKKKNEKEKERRINVGTYLEFWTIQAVIWQLKILTIEAFKALIVFLPAHEVLSKPAF